MEYIKIYILLYKIKKSPKKWIVKISDNYIELKNIIKDLIKTKNIINISKNKSNIDKFQDNIGYYYIITKHGKKSILDKKFKQFQIYTPYDKLLF